MRSCRVRSVRWIKLHQARGTDQTPVPRTSRHLNRVERYHMPTKVPLFSLCSFTLVLVVGWATVALSQGSGSSRVDAPRATRPQTPDEFHASFWNHIVKQDAAYNTWKVLSREKSEDGVENPHSTVSQTYANKIAADDPQNLPIGSILVREDYDDQRKRLSISVMYRVKAYDKDHGNWYWIKYLESGSVARGTHNKGVAGKVTSCSDCHGKAQGKDFVFSNDVPKVEKDAKADDQSSDTKKPPKE